jgi:hypothetical protein
MLTRALRQLPVLTTYITEAQELHRRLRVLLDLEEGK